VVRGQQASWPRRLWAAACRRTVCDAIGQATRGDRPPVRSPLTRALRGGVLLSRAVATGEVDAALREALASVMGGELDPGEVGELALRTASQAAALSATMR
jgi:hypothetical protein